MRRATNHVLMALVSASLLAGSCTSAKAAEGVPWWKQQKLVFMWGGWNHSRQDKSQHFWHADVPRQMFRNAASGLLFGVLVTAVVQSSSVTTSIVIPLAGAGLITIHQVFPYTLGANIGTTVTALLAAMASGNVAALTVAVAHLLFNVFGIVVIFPFRTIPITLAEKFAGLALKNRAIPIIFIIGIYLVLPFLFIFFAR